MMLFAAKKRWAGSLLAFVVLAVCAEGFRAGLRLEWQLVLNTSTLIWAGIGLAAIIASDTILHGIFSLFFGTPYRERFSEHVRYFEGQDVGLIVFSGLIAATEELFFRGVVLEFLLPWHPATAITVSAVLFGAAHMVPKERLWIFGIWAVWEGVILGALYWWSGSLLAVMIAHAAHDIWGYAVFAYQRKTGLFLVPEATDAP